METAQLSTTSGDRWCLSNPWSMSAGPNTRNVTVWYPFAFRTIDQEAAAVDRVISDWHVEQLDVGGTVRTGIIIPFAFQRVVDVIEALFTTLAKEKVRFRYEVDTVFGGGIRDICLYSRSYDLEITPPALMPRTSHVCYAIHSSEDVQDHLEFFLSKNQDGHAVLYWDKTQPVRVRLSARARIPDAERIATLDAQQQKRWQERKLAQEEAERIRQENDVERMALSLALHRALLFQVGLLGFKEVQEVQEVQKDKLSSKRGRHLSTEWKLEKLRKIRLDNIKNGKVMIHFTTACEFVPIDPKTVRGSELHKRWEDAEYREN